MQTEKEILEEIEIVREKLNSKVANTINRMPDSETLELSKKMDELLDRLDEVTLK